MVSQPPHRETTERLFCRFAGGSLQRWTKYSAELILDQSIVFSSTGQRKDIVFTRILSVVGFLYSFYLVIENVLNVSFFFFFSSLQSSIFSSHVLYVRGQFEASP